MRQVAERDADQLVRLVGGAGTETIVAHEVLGRLMIQCARQPGLASVYESMLGFEDAEFYIKPWPELTGGESVGARMHAL